MIGHLVNHRWDEKSSLLRLLRDIRSVYRIGTVLINLSRRYTMYDVTVKNNDSKVLFKGVVGCDWKRCDMAEAVKKVFSYRVTVIQKGGDPACKGDLIVVMDMTPQDASVLGNLLCSADWNYHTLKGYGNFIEQMIDLRKH
jgi:hypothetical protein